MIKTAYRIAVSAAEHHWTTLAVGGFVRDRLLGIPPKDVDLEFYGPESPSELRDFLATFGEVKEVGQSFGVFKINVDGFDLDCSLPRTESKVAEGSRGFVVSANSRLSLTEAAARRDYTINSMAYKLLSGEILDPYDGRRDLENHILRHTSEHFAEDPLRVIRGFQFCGRFELVSTTETVAMCKSLKSEYHTLSKDRIMGEWLKWAEKSVRPGLGLYFLRETGWIEFYPELERLCGLPQDERWHPEGDVWVHTLLAVDAAARIAREKGFSKEETITVVMATLLHDVGKWGTTELRKPHVKEEWRFFSKGHAENGETAAKNFLERIGAPAWVVEKVIPLVRCHMRHLGTKNAHIGKVVRRLARDLAPATMEEWAVVVEADHSSRPPLPDGLPDNAARITEAARVLDLEKSVPEPILMGRHLIKYMGWKGGPHFKTVLDAAYEAQLDGEFSDLEGARDWLYANWTIE